MEQLMKRYRLIVVSLTLTFSGCFERNLLPPCLPAFSFQNYPRGFCALIICSLVIIPIRMKLSLFRRKEGKVRGNTKYKLSIFPQHPDIVSVYSHCCNTWGEILNNYKTNNENKILLKNKVFCCYWYCF